jgi:hypothetical protein
LVIERSEVRERVAGSAGAFNAERHKSAIRRGEAVLQTGRNEPEARPWRLRGMTEHDLLSKINHRAARQDEAAWCALIAEARLLPANTMYAVLQEIARPPRGAELMRGTQLRLIDEWRRGFDHPLAEIVVSCSLARMLGRPVEIPLVLSIMRRVALYPGEYAALDIVAASADDATLPLAAFDPIDRLDLDIRSGWHTRQRVSR